MISDYTWDVASNFFKMDPLSYLLHQDEIRTSITEHLSIETMIRLSEALKVDIGYYIKDKDHILTKLWYVNSKEYPMVKFVESFGSILLSKLIYGFGLPTHFTFFKDYSWSVEHYMLERPSYTGLYHDQLVSPDLNKKVSEIVGDQDVEAYLIIESQLYLIRSDGFPIVNFLVGLGFDINSQFPDEYLLYVSGNLLYEAVTHNRIHLASKLLKLGANPNTSFDHSVLTMAVHMRNIDMIKLLVDYGADINYVKATIENLNPYFESPIQMAILDHYLDVVKLLISMGVDLTPRDIPVTSGHPGVDEEFTVTYDPVSYAEERGTPEIKDLILASL